MATRYTGVSGSILDAVGDTPLVEVEGIYAKLEFLNPSGAHLLAAKRVREQFPELQTVVTAFCDKGEKYLHEYFMGPPAGPVRAEHFG